MPQPGRAATGGHAIGGLGPSSPRLGPWPQPRDRHRWNAATATVPLGRCAASDRTRPPAPLRPGGPREAGARERPRRRSTTCPFIRACRGLSVDRAGVVHAPGRPIAARVPRRPGTGSILDAIAQPELVAELTRQPVDPLRDRCRHLLLRHRGPGGGHRVRRRCGPGDRSGGGRPLPGPGDLQRLRPLEPEPTRPMSSTP
jgi:hypothetical protein